MYTLKELLERGNPYQSAEGGLVALSAGGVPDMPPEWAQAAGGSFGSYALKVFDLARNVIMWWTPTRVEHEALRMAGDVEGPSILSQEAYAFRAIYLQVASLIAQSVYRVGAHLSGVVYVQMLRDLLHEAVTTLESKAQQVEARAMDLRLRYDAQKLRVMLGALEISPKLEKLIEAAQADNETTEHFRQMGEEITGILKQTAGDAASIKLIVESHWDRVRNKDVEEKKVTTMMAKFGAKAGETAFKHFLDAVVDAATRRF